METSLGVARRPYRSARREAQAKETRRRVTQAAHGLFLDRGYGATTMRSVARAAGCSVPTVEALFGTKGGLLKAAIDVAIAGDDRPVAVLDRPWATAARQASTLVDFLSTVSTVLAEAQARSAGLVLAVFEGAARDAELAALRAQMVSQREATATWIVDTTVRFAPLAGLTRAEAVDTVWLLMDPALYDRLTRERAWTVSRYARWFDTAVTRMLTATDASPAASSHGTRTLHSSRA